MSDSGDSKTVYPDRFSEWNVRAFPPIGYYAELWRSPRDDPDFPALEAKYGDKAEEEVARLQRWLIREVIAAAGGLLYTLGKIEALLGEMQTYVDEHVPPWPEDKPWPEFGVGIAHPRIVEASFEFHNFLGWLRAIDERLDRPHVPDRQQRVGLLPALADRPLRSRVETLVAEYQDKTLERKLANYGIHVGAVPQPLAGAQLTGDHSVSLRVPDRPSEEVSTSWELTYEQERDALTVAREAAQAVGLLVDELIEAFESEGRAVEQERAASV